MKPLIEELLRYLRRLWLNRWYVVSAAMVCCLVSWTYVLSMADEYRANAKFYVDANSRIRKVVSNLGMEPNVNSRMFLVRQALLSRGQLEDVIRQTDLDISASTDADMEALIARLRERINFGAGRSREASNLYEISYLHESRETALAVVGVLLNSFVENILEAKDSDSERATRFLDEQVTYYRELLEGTEKSIEAFKRNNPSFASLNKRGYFETLQAEREVLSGLESEYTIEKGKRSEILRQLSSVDPYVVSRDTVGNFTAASSSPTAQRLDSVNSRLEELLLSFTEKHPDVQALTAQRDMLQQVLLNETKSQTINPNVDGVKNANNPVYIEIQLALSQSNLKLTSLERQLSESRAKIDRYQKQLDTAPELEREYTELLRDYDKYSGLYDEVLIQSERERIGRVGGEQDVVTFNVIEPPTASLEPVSPDRPVMILACAAGSIMFALALGLLISELRPIVTDARELMDLTEQRNVQLIGEISYNMQTLGSYLRRRDTVRFGVAAAFLLFSLLAVLLFNSRLAQLLSAI